MQLRIYNTLTRQKEIFPKKPGETVTMYLCGPTVYKPSHIGHMVGPVIFDTVKRYLSYVGYQVKWVVNITDVDDKLIVRAKELNTTVKELAEKMTADYKECLKKLNVTGVDEHPKATDYIPGMIAMMQRLIAKGHAYPANGDVYFDISKDEDYGKLCNRDPDQLEVGSRIEVSDKKRNPGDFALWKSAKPGEPAWDSPWGKGRPGWHIECSVMSQALLGETLDIHGGGLDLQFPHHENELAQSESDTGKTFARFWMHNGLLKMGSAKMAGSIGNVVNIADLLNQFSAETIRLLLLSTHYRSPIEYSENRLHEISKAIQAYYRFFERYERITNESFYSIEPFKNENEYNKAKDQTRSVEGASEYGMFDHSMRDDFNTAGAIGWLSHFLTSLNKLAQLLETRFPTSQPIPSNSIDLINFKHGTSVLRTLTTLLGLFQEPPATYSVGKTLTLQFNVASKESELVAGLMQLLIDLRNNLRAEAKAITDKTNPTKKALFDQTDLIRRRLGELGVVLEDRAGGTTWRVGS